MDHGAAPHVLAIMGPTASGKTDLAMAIADRHPVDLISVDSAMIYRGMDIGTAKPDPQTLAEYPHALVDILDPSERYSVQRFCADARAQIARSRAAGRLPLLVGGTMLYFRSLLEGISALPETDEALRAEVRGEAARVGWAAMHEALARVDPEAAARIHPNDPQRIGRALEVWRATGIPMTRLQRAGRQGALEDSCRVLRVALAPADRATLRERIAMRFDQMIEAGFLDEVAGLRARGDLHADLPSMRSVGYRQVWAYLDGASDFSAMRQEAIAATRQFAKRQVTWLRSTRADLRLETGDPAAEEKILARL
ncbi:MAG: tRNA (adenosine(37)-N6)-dimethylallyltransferase MiaA [Halothiobacillaceae bacterium]